ncbi:MAG: UDP-N-acetylmuramoylalanine--D-glutamate ligase [Caldithrix sp. RBG_13_44_9]|nr:MAG: UDP-N-acetylmuramoylalanine--D-glutamate ligase [Caldithrix sp. RBG_13_44_9]
MHLEKKAELNRAQLKGTRIAVLGAARSGIAVSKLLVSAGASVLLSEVKPASQLTVDLTSLQKAGIAVETGKHSEAVLESALICISPGLPLDIPILKQAQQKGIPIVGEIEIASWFCKSPIFAITGSNGKTTTTTLAGQIFKKNEPSTVVAGNIGNPFSEFMLNKEQPAYVILEISSFQLETICSFHPRIAVLMNLTANHLDRYPDFDSYAGAKLNILMNMSADDLLIYNGDDSYLCKHLKNSKPRKLVFSQRPHSLEGAFWEHDTIVIQTEKKQQTIQLKKYQLQGPHNHYNMMVAALLAHLQHIPDKIIALEIAAFSGIEHRLELVRELNRISFFNDSKATTVDSLSYALQSFPGNIILIAGGKDKGGDFSEVNQLLKERVKVTILIGQASERMSEAWTKVIPVLRARTLPEAVKIAYHHAYPGDIVLLSPACSSFDMFRDYEDRGEQFKKIVAGLN